jgi:hypothetical protein
MILATVMVTAITDNPLSVLILRLVFRPQSGTISMLVTNSEIPVFSSVWSSTHVSM